jgi:thiamine-phosphate pyrophosphorylase
VKPLSECRLYTFLDLGYIAEADLRRVAEQLCAGSSDLIQLRAKGRSPDAVLRMACEILPVTRAANVGLVINDLPFAAQTVGAEFYHLGQEDYFGATTSVPALRGDVSMCMAPNPEPKTLEAAPDPAAHARSGSLPYARPEFGLSSHAPEEAIRAVSAGAAYVAIGPVFATPTKPGRPAVTLDYVRWAAANIRIPWFAIGGITLGNLPDVIAAGARRICVVSAILRAPDIARACGQFAQAIAAAEDGGGPRNDAAKARM